MNTEVIQTLFDRIWVVSLAASTDRRLHIAEHLPAVGISDYHFFDATRADDPSVAEATATGEVLTYPPCFRCGKLDCGRPDCNNYLAPPQIANVLTYRRLWRTIAEGDDERVLIVEDDVLVHPHAHRALGFVAAEVAAGRLPFAAGQRCLLRLGWAKCDDHNKGDSPCHIGANERMSNPCHAMTKDFARALLERDVGIRQTSDVYVNILAPKPGEAYTVFPPIASELSWTNGRFASTIHPKEVRVAHLRAQGDELGAEAEARRCARHVKKKHYRPVLITGHPWCGTGYAAELCRQLGLEIGHERLGSDGISSWMFAVDADENPSGFDPVARTRRAFTWRHLLMPVRELGTATASVMRESKYAPKSYAFRRDHIQRLLGLDLDENPDPFERAIWSITSWTRIIVEQEPALIFRIEDGHERLREFLIAVSLIGKGQPRVALDTRAVNADKANKGECYPKPEVNRDAWATLSTATRREVDWYCRTFGYALP